MQEGLESPAAPPMRCSSSSKILLSNLPSSVAAKLRALDADGDGILDIDELQTYHEDAQRTLSKARRGTLASFASSLRCKCLQLAD